MLYMFQNVFMGDYKEPHDGTESLRLKWNELAVLVPVLILIVWIGLQPAIFFHAMDSTTNELIVRLSEIVPTIAGLTP
jgi:NADH:ubiquinone oxidoreductase subunit 4 (subunit M)